MDDAGGHRPILRDALCSRAHRRPLVGRDYAARRPLLPRRLGDLCLELLPLLEDDPSAERRLLLDSPPGGIADAALLDAFQPPPLEDREPLSVIAWIDGLELTLDSIQGQRLARDSSRRRWGGIDLDALAAVDLLRLDDLHWRGIPGPAGFLQVGRLGSDDLVHRWIAGKIFGQIDQPAIHLVDRAQQHRAVGAVVPVAEVLYQHHLIGRGAGR